MQAVELGALLELGECAREVVVAEHLIRLEALVGAAEQHGVRALADELDALEVLDDRRHRQGEDALAGQRVRGGDRGRLQLLVLQLDPERADLGGERLPRVRGVVGDEAEPVASLA